ncbi:MAG: ThuA domain-containing protein [Phycisphaeraceae bacterium]
MNTFTRSFAIAILLIAVAHQSGIAADSLTVTKRSRVESKTEAGTFDVITKAETWNPKESVIIVCDVWDAHHCLNAVRRVEEMAPRMNQVIEKARGQGFLIIHAPSGCMKAYEGTPGRKLAQSAPKAGNLPKDIGSWCYKIPSEEKGTYPIDQTDGGEDDDLKEHAEWAEKLKAMGRNPRAPWTKQYDVVKIHDGDAISDNGVEIWNLLESRGIKNVILLGVHTNMCVLGRPFGLRRMAENGKNVVLMRDMTDTMYNPQRWPYVSHYKGTDLIIEHIEKWVCPTITSDAFLGGESFVFKAAKSPRIVVAIAEAEYDTKVFLPAFAKAFLRKDNAYDVRILMDDPKDANKITGFGEALKDCDLLFLSVRRRSLPKEDLDALRDYLKAGKPLVAIRTSSHAFDTKGKHADGQDEWPTFDRDILGGHYQNHHGNGQTCTVTLAAGAADHPIVSVLLLDKMKYESPLSLYRSAPLAKTATPLLMGTIPGKDPEPVAWTHMAGKSRVFYTSLADFTNARYVLMLKEAIDWCLAEKAPK